MQHVHYHVFKKHQWNRPGIIIDSWLNTRWRIWSVTSTTLVKRWQRAWTSSSTIQIRHSSTIWIHPFCSCATKMTYPEYNNYITGQWESFSVVKTRTLVKHMGIGYPVRNTSDFRLQKIDKKVNNKNYSINKISVEHRPIPKPTCEQLIKLRINCELRRKEIVWN